MILIGMLTLVAKNFLNMLTWNQFFRINKSSFNERN